MFGKKSSSNKVPSSSSKTSRGSLSQYGLFDVPNLDSLGNVEGDEDDDVDDEDDADLEAELMSMISTNKPVKSNKRNMQVMPNVQNLDKMIAESLKDISDSEVSSNEEEDSDLMAELGELITDGSNDDAPVMSNEPIKLPQRSSYDSLLKERLQMYEIAQQNLKSAGDQSKLRRIDRGIKTLQSLKKQAEAGNPINEDDIPPPISTGSKAATVCPAVDNNAPSVNQANLVIPEIENTTKSQHPSLPVPPPRTNKSATSDRADIAATDSVSSSPEKKIKPNNNDVEATVSMLLERQQQYKQAAVEAKRSGNIETALGYVKIVKQFDVAINAIKEGTPVDLSSIPAPPTSAHPTSSNNSVQNVPSISSLETQQKGENERQTSVELPKTSNKESESPKPIPQPKTVLESLEQRLAKYKEMQATAKEENNDRKARQMGRIIDQYAEAIKLHKKGKPIDVESLPTPLGYPPIPTENAAPKPVVSAVTDNKPATTSHGSPSSHTPSVNPEAAKRDKSGAVTRNDRQTKQLLEKQRLFKVAALKSKQEGNVEEAKEYLKKAKQLQPLIDASLCGLPVDMNTVPITPGENAALEEISDDITLNTSIPGTDKEVFEKLIADLHTQLDLCMKTRDHFKTIGDIANANRFEQFAVRSKKDLTIIELACAQNLAVPKFHYETKPFSIVQCNADLTDNEVEVTIVQGISYNVPNPKEIDTYVKLTFPYPTETPQIFKTSVIYNTNNPNYDVTHSFSIQRNLRACQRIFKRQAIKCEVWSKGGFFRSDSLVGTVSVKLQPLETQTTIHDAFDLMDGRRVVGGKLELKVRARNPILKQQVEHVEQKWLFIDG